MSFPTFEINCVECEIELLDNYQEKVYSKCQFPVFEFRKWLLSEKKPCQLPNNYLKVSLSLLYADCLTRECFLRMKDAPKNNQLFGRAQIKIGEYFECLATKMSSNDVVLEVHEALLDCPQFKPFYGKNKLQNYMESLFSALDSLVNQSYLAKCMPKDGDQFVGQSRNNLFKIGLIAGRFGTHRFQSNICLNCNIKNEKQVQNTINAIELKSDQQKNKNSVVSKLTNFFKRKNFVQIEDFVANKAPKPIQINCQICNETLANSLITEHQQSNPETTIFAIDDSRQQLALKDKIQLQFESETITKCISFVYLTNEGSAQSIYVKVTEYWICITNNSVLRLSCDEFNEVLSNNSHSVSLVAYSKLVEPNMILGNGMTADIQGSIKLPLSICVLLQEPKKLSFSLSQLFCDHFELKPAAFKLDYSSSFQLHKTAKLALIEYGIFAQIISKQQFFTILSNSNLLSKYGCHFDEMANAQICQTCMKKERKRTFIDGLQLSLKLKIIENKTKCGAAFVKNNKEMVELTFSNDFAKRVCDNIKRTGNLLGISQKESNEFNNDFNVQTDDSKLVESGIESNMRISNFTFKGSNSRLETLIGPFEESLIKSITSKTQSNDEIDMNDTLPKLRAAMNVALNVSSSDFTTVGCKQLQADIQEVVTQTTHFVPRQSLQVPLNNNLCDSPLPKFNCLVSPTDVKFLCPQITIQPVDYLHKQQHADSFFKRKPVNRSGDKKHCSAINETKNSNFIGKKLELNFGHDNNEIEFLDIESAERMFPSLSVASGGHNDRMRTSPDQTNSLLDRIEITEFNKPQITKSCMRKRSSKTPVHKRTIWPTSNPLNSPNVSAELIANSQSKSNISHFNDERIENGSQRADTPAVPAHVHFFEDPSSVKNDHEDADSSYRLGCIRTNKKSKFVNPQNNSILTDISRSEISSMHRSIYEIITMRLEAEADAKKSTNQFHQMIVETASNNLKKVVRQCVERLNFECKVRLQHNIVKPAPVTFMLTIKKDKENVQPAPKVINLAKNELSNQKRGLEWTALGDITTNNSENFTSPAQRNQFNQSSIEKANIGPKDFGMAPVDSKRNVFLERLEEVSEETKKSVDSRKEIEELGPMPVLSLCKIDSRFAPLAIPLTNNETIGKVFREKVNVFCMPKTANSEPLQTITIGIEYKKLDGSPIGRKQSVEQRKERPPLASRQQNSENHSLSLNCSTRNDSIGKSKKSAKLKQEPSGRKAQSSKVNNENSFQKRN